eukprot:RCo016517
MQELQLPSIASRRGPGANSSSRSSAASEYPGIPELLPSISPHGAMKESSALAEELELSQKCNALKARLSLRTSQIESVWALWGAGDNPHKKAASADRRVSASPVHPRHGMSSPAEAAAAALSSPTSSLRLAPLVVTSSPSKAVSTWQHAGQTLVIGPKQYGADSPLGASPSKISVSSPTSPAPAAGTALGSSLEGLPSSGFPAGTLTTPQSPPPPPSSVGAEAALSMSCSQGSQASSFCLSVSVRSGTSEGVAGLASSGGSAELETELARDEQAFEAAVRGYKEALHRQARLWTNESLAETKSRSRQQLCSLESQKALVRRSRAREAEEKRTRWEKEQSDYMRVEFEERILANLKREAVERKQIVQEYKTDVDALLLSCWIFDEQRRQRVIVELRAREAKKKELLENSLSPQARAELKLQKIKVQELELSERQRDASTQGDPHAARRLARQLNDLSCEHTRLDQLLA